MDGGVDGSVNGGVGCAGWDGASDMRALVRGLDEAGEVYAVCFGRGTGDGDEESEGDGLEAWEGRGAGARPAA